MIRGKIDGIDEEERDKGEESGGKGRITGRKVESKDKRER